jgi:nucleotide-binding universal stress UspA family protein
MGAVGRRTASPAEAVPGDGADEYEREALTQAAAAGVPANAVVSDSPLAMEKYARAQRADAIVIGTDGSSPLQRNRLGSDALAIIRSADVPVFSVSGQARIDGTGPILVAMDASAPAEAALTAAVSLARSQRATLQVVHIFDDSDLARIPEHIGYDPETTRRQAMTAVTDECDDVADRLRAAGVPFSMEMVEGEPAAQLADVASRAEARFIAIGTHQRNFMSRLAMGSVAEEVVRVSPVPVMTVRR